jgi:hypothetical protein
MNNFEDIVDVVNFKDIVESNGKTIEQNNLSNGYKYPIGTLVKFDTEVCHDKSVVKISGTLYVMEHTRDCDGSPLYLLGSMDLSKPGNKKDYDELALNLNLYARMIYKKGLFNMVFNIGEDSLSRV